MTGHVGTICQRRISRILPKVPVKPWDAVLRHGTNYGDVMSGRVSPFRARWRAEGCGCNGLVGLLNKLGPRGCRGQLNDLVSDMHESAADYSTHIQYVPAALRTRALIRLALLDCIRLAEKEIETDELSRTDS